MRAGSAAAALNQIQWNSDVRRDKVAAFSLPHPSLFLSPPLSLSPSSSSPHTAQQHTGTPKPNPIREITNRANGFFWLWWWRRGTRPSLPVAATPRPPPALLLNPRPEHPGAPLAAAEGGAAAHWTVRAGAPPAGASSGSPDSSSGTAPSRRVEGDDARRSIPADLAGVPGRGDG